MTSLSLSKHDKRKILGLAASAVWADLEVDPRERAFLLDLAYELEIEDALGEIDALARRPPLPEDVDPTVFAPAVADAARQAVLRAIAADGRVDPHEMAYFELLDELLPRSDGRALLRSSSDPRSREAGP
jgi:hypothetical protein